MTLKLHNIGFILIRSTFLFYNTYIIKKLKLKKVKQFVWSDFNISELSKSIAVSFAQSASPVVRCLRSNPGSVSSGERLNLFN